MSYVHPQQNRHSGPHIPPEASKDPYEAANRDYFDQTASQQRPNRPDEQQRAEQIGKAMIDTGLFEQGVTIMDFACGAGLISRTLAARSPKLIVGVDISQGMVDRYNEVVSDHGIPPEKMRAVCVPPYELLQDLTFDTIVCVSAYHHIADIVKVTTFLSTYLNPGGSLLVADLVHSEFVHKTFPEYAQHIVAHKDGFKEEDIRSTFERAGLKNVTFDIVAHVSHGGHPVDMFLARGDKIESKVYD